MLNIHQLFSTHGITPKGVIHIGAHEGQELALYKSMGFKTILLIEADPDTYRLLEGTVGRAGIGPEIKGNTINVAISDHDGHATLYRTSNSQSNSLLRLKDHLEVYPYITETGHIKVPTRRLDTLLNELKIDPSLFNYLHMDIQGGEYQALQGATNTLQYIEAITSEVNQREMYEGAVLQDQLEEWLDGGGRRYQRKDEIVGGDGWGDAFYVRRPFVQMSCIGQLGRFGNAAWQYMFGLVKSHQTGADLRTNWMGAGIFDFGIYRKGIGPYPCLPGLKIDYEDTHLVENSRHLWGSNNPILGKNYEDIAGFYQFHTSFYRPWKDKIRQVFRVTDRANWVYSAVAHLRWGDDYGQQPQRAPFFRTPVGQVKEWAKMVEGKMFQNCSAFLVTPVTHICTDAPYVELLGEGLPAKYMAGAVARSHPHDALAYDFDMMVNANYLLVSNSSLSMFAALLNRNFDDEGWRGHCYRPVPKLGPGKVVEAVEIEEFDPWNADVLLGK